MKKRVFKRWTFEEIKILEDETLTNPEVVNALEDRSYQAVKQKRTELNIFPKTSIDYWKEEEIKFLANNRSLSNKEISKKLGRTHQAVSLKRQKLNLLQISDEWDDFEIEYLISNYGIVRGITIANYLGRSEPAIRTKASELGITRKNEYWQKHEVEILMQNFEKTNEEISNLVNKSIAQISYKKAHIKSLEKRKVKVNVEIRDDIGFSNSSKENQYIDALYVLKIGESFEFPKSEYQYLVKAKHHFPKKVFITKKENHHTRRVWRLA